ncbi:hypothetical protein, partial [Vibrio aerogenes]
DYNYQTFITKIGFTL